MIAERLPQLAAMSREEKRELYFELREEFQGDDYDVSETPEGRAAIAELLEARMAHYRGHPESARPWDEVRERLRQQLKAWRAARNAP